MPEVLKKNLMAETRRALNPRKAKPTSEKEPISWLSSDAPKGKTINGYLDQAHLHLAKRLEKQGTGHHFHTTHVAIGDELSCVITAKYAAVRKKDIRVQQIGDSYMIVIGKPKKETVDATTFAAIHQVEALLQASKVKLLTPAQSAEQYAEHSADIRRLKDLVQAALPDSKRRTKQRFAAASQ